MFLLILALALTASVSGTPETVYTDLSLPMLPHLKWKTFMVYNSHQGSQPNQPSSQWANASIEIWDETIFQITTNTSGNIQAEVIYFSVDYAHNIFSLSIQYWSRPFLLFVGRGHA